MVFQHSAKHEGPVSGWHLIGLASEVQKEAELVFSALQGSKEYFATLVTRNFNYCWKLKHLSGLGLDQIKT